MMQLRALNNVEYYMSPAQTFLQNSSTPVKREIAGDADIFKQIVAQGYEASSRTSNLYHHH